MLKTLKELFDGFAGRPPDPLAHAHAVQLAAAVLLMEVVRADARTQDNEHAAVQDALRRTFALSDAALARLMAEAEQSLRQAYDYHRYSSSINAFFTHAQKVQIIEAMWLVAYVDAHLDAHESHLISKIAGLLHVTHGEYIAAKMHAKAASPAAR